MILFFIFSSYFTLRYLLTQLLSYLEVLFKTCREQIRRKSRSQLGYSLKTLELWYVQSTCLLKDTSIASVTILLLRFVSHFLFFDFACIVLLRLFLGICESQRGSLHIMRVRKWGQD